MKNVRVNGHVPLDDRHVKETIAEAENRLGEKGRLVIRPSGTEPLIRVMAEGDDRSLVELVVGDIVDAISSVRDAA